MNLLAPLGDFEFYYEFKMLRDKDKDAQTEDDSKFWFPVSKILQFAELQDAFEYCVEHGLTQGGQKFPWRTLTELWRVIKEKLLIHFFLEEEQDLDKVQQFPFWLLT